MQYSVRLLDLEAGGKYIVVMSVDDARTLGVISNDRLMLDSNGTAVVAILNTSEVFPRGVLGMYKEIGEYLGVDEGDPIDVEPAERPESLLHIRSKIMGEKLTPKHIDAIVEDVVQRHLSSIELSSFVTALQIHGTSMEEIEALSRSMIKWGKTIDFGRTPICDKHSIGGVPGDKTTMIVVPIIAAAGYTIPKSSSRAITSPAGTADRMEAICPVNLRLEEIIEVVNDIGACIVWGGALDLAPADDLFIQVEYPLSIDPLLLPSIMSKKKAMGSTHVVVDIPTGREAKIKTMEEAQQLAINFIELGNRLGIEIRCAVTEGEQPIGYCIGPSLEAREALKTLAGSGPPDVVDKATSIAGILLEMVGEENGQAKAMEMLTSGKAEAKMREIIGAQGGDPDIRSEDLVVGDERLDVRAAKDGRILLFKNRSIAQLARVAGAPNTKCAGIELGVKLGDEVKEGDVLFSVYTDSLRKLGQVEDLVKRMEPILVGNRIGEKMIMMKISESTTPGSERYIIDR
ncbi:AMP phosphorylase [archaeon]|nr:AMP phosphorylase [archaeon]